MTRTKLLSYEGSKAKNVVEQGAKKFVSFTLKCKSLAFYAIKVSKVSSTYSYTSLVQDPMVT